MTLLLALLLGCRWFAPEPAPVADEDVAAFARDMATRCAGLFVVEANGDTVLLVRDARVDIEPLHEQEVRFTLHLDGVDDALNELEFILTYQHEMSDWPMCVGLLVDPGLDRQLLERLATNVIVRTFMPFIHFGPTTSADRVHATTPPGTPYQRGGGPPCPPVVALQVTEEGRLHMLPRQARRGNPEARDFHHRPPPHIDVVLPGLVTDAKEVEFPADDGRFPLAEATTHLQQIIEHPEHVVIAVRMDDFATTRDLAATAGAIAEATGASLWLTPPAATSPRALWHNAPQGSQSLHLEARIRPFKMARPRYSDNLTACP